MKNCENCNKSLFDVATFCDRCGTECSISMILTLTNIGTDISDDFTEKTKQAALKETWEKDGKPMSVWRSNVSHNSGVQGKNRATSNYKTHQTKNILRNIVAIASMVIGVLQVVSIILLSVLMGTWSLHPIILIPLIFAAIWAVAYIIIGILFIKTEHFGFATALLVLFIINALPKLMLIIMAATFGIFDYMNAIWIAFDISIVIILIKYLTMSKEPV